jgi:hypothetical protein
MKPHTRNLAAWDYLPLAALLIFAVVCILGCSSLKAQASTETTRIPGPKSKAILSSGKPISIQNLLTHKENNLEK